MLKKLLGVLVLVTVFGGSALAFAWWDTLEQTEDETLTIGQGVTLEVAAVAEAPAGKVLVPAGVVLKADDVEEIVLTYNVKLDLAAIDALNLTVVASDILIGGVDTYANLVNIVVTLGSPTVNNTDVLVTVTVTLTEPTTEVEYNAIINQIIGFTLTFTAS